MKNTIKIFTLISLLALSQGCNDEFLDRFPETQIGTENFFNTEEDLAMYIYGLYSFPSHGEYIGDRATDNQATTGNTELKTMMISEPSSGTINSGWNWGRLRSINLFLENFRKADITESQLNHYEGVARFFRANFYVEKVKRFSDVPFYDQVISTNDDELLFKERDPRSFVVDKIMEDYQFAAENVSNNTPEGAVNNWVVKSYFARFALYEGTYRKYHSELGLEGSANGFLQQARDIAKDIMDNGGFSIHNTGNPTSDYGDLFVNTNLRGNSEVIFAREFEQDLVNSGWWTYIFGNYEACPTKDLLQSYLMDDGSYYTNQPEYESNLFVEEFEDRDPRLMQTYAYPGWELVNTGTYSQGGGVYVQQLNKNFSGYHQIKGFVNSLDNSVIQSVDFPVLRLAETLLIYAEARAELAELNQADLDMTINVLRDRAGMPHMTMGVATDPMQSSRYPNINTSQAAELLEIRRERRVELALEGYRYDDIMRWHAGKLLEDEPEGIYFPSLGKYDLTGDGIEDIYLISASESIPTEKETNSLGDQLIYYRTGAVGEDASVFLQNGSSGSMVTVVERGTFVEPKFYYRPIPLTHTTVNNNLTQIFGWD